MSRAAAKPAEPPPSSFEELAGPEADFEVFQTVEDVYRPTERSILSRALRSFLDRAKITISELLHFPNHLRRLKQAFQVVREAIRSIVRRQSASRPVDAQTRTAEMEELFEQLVSTESPAVDAEMPVAVLETPADFDALVLRSSELRHGEREVLRQLAVRLTRFQDWPEKIAFLVMLDQGVADREAQRLLDQVLGEMLSSTAATATLFATARTPYDHLLALVALCRRTPPAATVSARPEVTALLALAGIRPHPECRRGLEENIVQQLVAPEALASPALEEELRSVHHLLETLSDKVDPVGGKRAQAALDQRLARIATRDAVAEVVRGRQGLANRLQLLLEIRRLLGASIAARQVEELIDEQLALRDFESRLLADEDPLKPATPEQQLGLIAGLHASTLAAGLARKRAIDLAARLNHLQLDTLSRTRLFVTIDRQATGPDKKVLEMVRLCQSGVLFASGLEAARKIICQHIRKPSTMVALLAAIPGESKADRMQAVNRLLQTAGVTPALCTGH